uniref:Secreted protein n=1 Tax=Anguilla anguilla TaxID=7936 RepID=A0A0E9PGF7_ANGAN
MAISAMTSVSPVWCSLATPPCGLGMWCTSWSCGASPVSTPSSLPSRTSPIWIPWLPTSPWP